MTPLGASGVIGAFWARYVEDLERGAVGALSHYQTLFPGYEAAIAKEYAALREPTELVEAERCIGTYRLLRQLGRGGQATVWLAQDRELHRNVALKVLDAALALTPSAAQRFRREADLAARLDHPGICPIYATGSDDGVAWIAMRFIEGQTLAQQLEQQRAATPRPSAAEIRTAVALLAEVADTIHAAHGAGVVHRDLKPGNIMVTPSGRAVVLDFGLARDESDPALTQSQTLLGTPAYMAPEQIQPERGPRDRRTDVHALGAILYECVTGQRAFAVEGREALYRAILAKDPPPAHKVNSAVPRDLATVIANALAKDPARRYGSAAALADDLRAVAESRPIAARPTSPWVRALLWAKREPARAALLALAAATTLLAASLGGYLLAEAPRIRGAREFERHLRVRTAVGAGYRQLIEDRWIAAAASFDAALAEAPTDLEAIAGAILTTMIQRDLAHASALFARHRAAIDAYPGHGLAMLEERLRKRQAQPFVNPRPNASPSRPHSAFDSFLMGLSVIDDAEHGNRGAMHTAVRWFNHAVSLAAEPRPEFHAQRARAAAVADDPLLAADCAGSLQALWPDSAFALAAAADALVGVDPQAALQLATRGAGLEPDNTYVLDCLARAQARCGATDAAIASLRRVLALSPRASGPRTNLARLLREAGDPAAAIAEYEAVIAGEPRFSRAADQLTELLTSLGRGAAAHAVIATALERDPADARALFAQARLALREGDPQATIAALQSACAADPGFGEAHLSLGGMLRADGQLAASLPALRRAVELLPETAQAHLELALALHASGDAAAARPPATRARQLLADLPDGKVRKQLEQQLATLPRD